MVGFHGGNDGGEAVCNRGRGVAGDEFREAHVGAEEGNDDCNSVGFHGC